MCRSVSYGFRISKLLGIRHGRPRRLWAVVGCRSVVGCFARAQAHIFNREFFVNNYRARNLELVYEYTTIVFSLDI